MGTITHICHRNNRRINILLDLGTNEYNYILNVRKEPYKKVRIHRSNNGGCLYAVVYCYSSKDTLWGD